ncbi:hypothetical protein HY970_01130 [Candidatus Kaiserbacteria bacterium]|nr:hypothetical protein [Candidatus Kaiserbacteria bacterium]
MRVATLTVIASLLFPVAVFAFPFGGQVGQVVNCYNQAIWARVGPPIGGDYVWTPSTQTYRFGAPSHPGQWLLGLASVPYYCLVSVIPIIIYPGITIQMMGSSQ